MRVIPIESRMFYAVRYDSKKHELEVFFNSGGVYRYQNIERDVFEGLLKAKSKGRYMHENVIGQYSDYKVAD